MPRCWSIERLSDFAGQDNCLTMHLALGDYDPPARRRLERKTVLGTSSGHVVDLEVSA